MHCGHNTHSKPSAGEWNQLGDIPHREREVIPLLSREIMEVKLKRFKHCSYLLTRLIGMGATIGRRDTCVCMSEHWVRLCGGITWTLETNGDIVVLMWIIVLWIVTLYILIDAYQGFEGTYRVPAEGSVTSLRNTDSLSKEGGDMFVRHVSNKV
jgi:hypothetical protein